MNSRTSHSLANKTPNEEMMDDPVDTIHTHAVFALPFWQRARIALELVFGAGHFRIEAEIDTDTVAEIHSPTRWTLTVDSWWDRIHWPWQDRRGGGEPVTDDSQAPRGAPAPR